MNDIEHEVFAVFDKKTNRRVSQWYSRKHDAIVYSKKFTRHIPDTIFVARIKFTVADFEIIND